MKSLLAFSLLAIATTSAHANSDCTSGVDNVLSKLAPTSTKVRVTGKYTKKSEETGDYKDCSVAISLYEPGRSLNLDFTPESFNPLNGDGSAFWPFGKYPTYEPITDDYDRVISYECSADADSFSMDYTYRSKTGWRKKSRYTAGLQKNNDGSYSISLRAGNGYANDKLTTCKGTISEEN